MKVPAEMTVQLVSQQDDDLGDLIVEMLVSTGQRNPRRIHFPKTDALGRSMVTREDFLGQFSDATEEDLMGSWGSIRDALPAVEVRLHDTKSAIKAGGRTWPLGRHERTKWPSAAVEYTYRTSSRNHEFTAAPVVVNLGSETPIVLRVARVGERSG